MKIFILLIGLNLSCYAATYHDYYVKIVSSEGYRNKPYKDSGGWAVGIGHYSPNRFPKNYYSNEEIQAFFRADLNNALKLAKETFPSFEKQPKEVKLILVSLSFNLGNKIKDFKDFRKAIEGRNYKRAAAELKDSRWYFQTGNRGRKYVEILNKMG